LAIPIEKNVRRRGFTIVEMLTTTALLVIVLGLMVSLARHVRQESADQLTKDILHRLDEAMTAYVNRDGMLPPVQDFIGAGNVPDESVLVHAAENNNEGFVHALKARGMLIGKFDNLSIAFYDEVRVRDAWGSPIVFMARMHPAIGMNPRGWFFFSAGPDRKYLTREDNLYSYDQPAGSGP
jgi:prepilin-type N-terminal cleavage/methylation domain-containing protein